MPRQLTIDDRRPYEGATYRTHDGLTVSITVRHDDLGFASYPGTIDRVDDLCPGLMDDVFESWELPEHARYVFVSGGRQRLDGRYLRQIIIGRQKSRIERRVIASMAETMRDRTNKALMYSREATEGLDLASVEVRDGKKTLLRRTIYGINATTDYNRIRQFARDVLSEARHERTL